MNDFHKTLINIVANACIIRVTDVMDKCMNLAITTEEYLAEIQVCLDNEWFVLEEAGLGLESFLVRTQRTLDNRS